MEVSGSLHSPPTLPPGKEPGYLTDEGMEIKYIRSSERGSAADRPAHAMNETQLLCRKLAVHT
jgi:hypothetical protein